MGQHWRDRPANRHYGLGARRRATNDVLVGTYESDILGRNTAEAGQEGNADGRAQGLRLFPALVSSARAKTGGNENQDKACTTALQEICGVFAMKPLPILSNGQVALGWVAPKRVRVRCFCGKVNERYLCNAFRS